MNLTMTTPRSLRRLRIRLRLRKLEREVRRLEARMIETSMASQVSLESNRKPSGRTNPQSGSPSKHRRAGLRSRRLRAVALGLSLTLVLVGSGLGTRSTYIETKRFVASRLIAATLQRNLQTGELESPWPWADFRPVAQLLVPRIEESAPVLSGSTGGSLAFGLGLIDGTGSPKEGGNIAIAGHRDREFSWLGRLRAGDEVRLASHGEDRHFVVDSIHVVPKEDTRWIEPSWENRLTLVTCYPLDAWVEKGQRLIVSCREMEDVRPI